MLLNFIFAKIKFAYSEASSVTCFRIFIFWLSHLLGERYDAIFIISADLYDFGGESTECPVILL